MKINFTKNEYRNLVDLLVMADWVLNAHSTSSNTCPQKYTSLIQKLYSYSKEMDCEDIVTFNKLLNEYWPTQEIDEGSEVRQYIEEFEENTFWTELISNLSDRDLLKKHDKNETFNLNPEEIISATCEAEAIWSNEFEKNGLERIGIIER